MECSILYFSAMLFLQQKNQTANKLKKAPDAQIPAAGNCGDSAKKEFMNQIVSVSSKSFLRPSTKAEAKANAAKAVSRPMALSFSPVSGTS